MAGRERRGRRSARLYRRPTGEAGALARAPWAPCMRTGSAPGPDSPGLGWAGSAGRSDEAGRLREAARFAAATLAASAARWR